MLFEELHVGPLDVNCYILGCEETKEAVVIDPGGHAEKIKNSIDRLNLKVKWILITHGHFDHTGGLKKLKELIESPVCIHKNDEVMLKEGANHALFFGFNIDQVPPADRLLEDGEEIKMGNYTIKVIHTPGHSPGGVSYYAGDKVFAGDLLFAGSIGRTDLPGGNYETLIDSVKTKIFSLPGSTSVYPGHGPGTTVKEEIDTNPFFK
ncbi:MAG: MBL fold metallo-hydrolase [Candidatus Eremiobacterota bacterium]